MNKIHILFIFLAIIFITSCTSTVEDPILEENAQTILENETEVNESNIFVFGSDEAIESGQVLTDTQQEIRDLIMNESNESSNENIINPIQIISTQSEKDKLTCETFLTNLCQQITCENCLLGHQSCIGGEWDDSFEVTCAECKDSSMCKQGFICEDNECVES